MRLSDRRVTAAAQFHQSLTALITTLLWHNWTSDVSLCMYLYLYLYVRTCVLVIKLEPVILCLSENLMLPDSPNNRTCLSEPPNLQDVCRSCWSPGQAQQVPQSKGRGECSICYITQSEHGQVSWVSYISWVLPVGRSERKVWQNDWEEGEFRWQSGWSGHQRRSKKQLCVVQFSLKLLLQIG